MIQTKQKDTPGVSHKKANTQTASISWTETAQKESHHSVAYFAVKRFFDVFLSILALLIASPILLITAIVIFIDDGRPIFYAQTRCGKNGKTFKMYKFRSMCREADQMLEELEKRYVKNGPAFKMACDPRVTRVGHFIRKFSIDELPQFINVLKGDMSIVGPRPPLPDEVKEYTSYQMQRLGVKPGITCYWQVSGRSDLSFEKWVELDLKYIQNQSFLTDLKIMLLTAPEIFSTKGAY